MEGTDLKFLQLKSMAPNTAQLSLNYPYVYVMHPYYLLVKNIRQR